MCNPNPKKEYWKIPLGKPDIPRELLHAGYAPLLSAVLALRGFHTVREAEAATLVSDQQLHDPFLMNGMREACSRIRQSVESEETVAVYGDYDVDGITSTCLLTDYLRSCGVNCIPYIPDRSSEGYGLNCSAIDKLSKANVTLIITVDCGITAVQETEYARSLGIDVIITDHHECRDNDLPDAVAVIDCKRPDNTYPYRDLCGVGVAFKLACALSGQPEAIVEEYCDLAAIGTIADVMPLTEENKYIVTAGLQKIVDAPRPGLRALLHESGVNPERLNAASISFTISPRLNAAGRLGSALTAARLLMSKEPEEAARLAEELCALNKKRQDIEKQIMQEAILNLHDKEPVTPIVLNSDEWNQGVIGIAASRLSERFSVPTIMIWSGGETGKGSCRSYGNFNIYDALTACSQHLVSFGGHAQAAGINIQTACIDAFRQALAEYYLSHLPDPVPDVSCDLLIRDASLLDIKNVQALDLLEPYGNANEKPILCVCDAEVIHLVHVGGGKHLKMTVAVDGREFDAIYFSHNAADYGINIGSRVDIAFQPQINEYNSHVSVQLYVNRIRLHNAEELCRKILTGTYSEALYAMKGYLPDRKVFIRVWRSLQSLKTDPYDWDSFLAAVPQGIPPEQFSICVCALRELGLLQFSPDNVFCLRQATVTGKADLESAAIISALKAFSLF